MAIEEFTYLRPTRWNGTRSIERMPHLVRYWTEANPRLLRRRRGGELREPAGRADGALTRLAALPGNGPVSVFSHRQFIQAVRSIVVDTDLEARGKMRRFWRAGAPPAIGNAEQIDFALAAEGVGQHGAAPASTSTVA